MVNSEYVICATELKTVKVSETKMARSDALSKCITVLCIMCNEMKHRFKNAGFQIPTVSSRVLRKMYI